jgi:hypothetical protein
MYQVKDIILMWDPFPFQKRLSHSPPKAAMDWHIDLNKKARQDPIGVSEGQTNLIEAIIAGTLDLDFEKTDDRAAFVEKYHQYFTGGLHGTLIHAALRIMNRGNFHHFKPMFCFLLEKYPVLLRARNEIGETVLHYAIDRRLDHAVEFVCRCAAPFPAAQAISSRDILEGKCLHAAVRRLEQPVLEYLISICEV